MGETAKAAAVVVEEKRKKKAVFVDGANFFHMCRVHDIGGRTKLEELFKILVHEIGTPHIELWEKRPLYVGQSENMRKALLAAGFRLVVQSSKDGKDDAYIRSQIAQINPDDVQEIVLVSCDWGYIETLEEKMQHGVHVYLVSTRMISNGSPMLSSLYERIFGAGEGSLLHVVEFADYKNRIMLGPWVDKPIKQIPQGASGGEYGNGVNLPMHVQCLVEIPADSAPHVVSEIAAQFARWKMKYTGCSFSLTITNE